MRPSVNNKWLEKSSHFFVYINIHIYKKEKVP